MKYDFLIVGAGLYGSVFAYESNKRGKKCLVIDRRSHIGGNIYCDNIASINIHKYGPHIFHTKEKAIWDYINQFAEFNHYVNSPIAIFKDEIYNLPFNMNTFSKMWGVRTPAQAQMKIQEQICPLSKGRECNLEEKVLSLVGVDIYNKLVKGYTEKQWGRDCKNLPSSLISRLPFRFTYNNNYFDDPFQGVPKGGYNQIAEKMLIGCDVQLNLSYSDFLKAQKDTASTVVFTGCIDEYFDYSLGALEYRSLRFETEELQIDNYQGNAVVNFTERDIPYTRIIEHKHFEFENQPTTVISREYPLEWAKGMESYYPINDDKNNAIYRKYEQMAAQQEHLFFGGRLGSYNYYNMDQTIGAALLLVEEIL